MFVLGSFKAERWRSENIVVLYVRGRIKPLSPVMSHPYSTPHTSLSESIKNGFAGHRALLCGGSRLFPVITSVPAASEILSCLPVGFRRNRDTFGHLSPAHPVGQEFSFRSFLLTILFSGSRGI